VPYDKEEIMCVNILGILVIRYLRQIKGGIMINKKISAYFQMGKQILNIKLNRVCISRFQIIKRH